jgi:diamine N-acetyltransferase
VQRVGGHVVIREWKVSDLPAVREITWQTWLATYARFIPEKDLREYFRTHYSLPALSGLFETHGVDGYIAELEGQCVGYAKTKFERVEHRFYVSSLYVLPDYQGMGIGTKLLRSAEECAHRYGVVEVWLGVMVHNVEALAWYKKIGFQFVEEAPFTMGNSTVSHVIGFRKIH